MQVSPRHRSSSVQQLIADIVEQITNGTLGPGDFLPSAHTLAEKYHIGYVSVIRAYKTLSEQGYIETGKGRGAFVRNPSCASVTELTVILPSQESISHLQNPHSDWVMKELLVGMNSATVEMNIRLNLLFTDIVGEQWQSIIDNLQRSNGVIFVLTAPAHWVLRLQKRGIPYALVFPLQRGLWEGEIPCFYPDYPGSVRSLVIQACAAGHTRAAFLGRVDCPHEGARYQGYVAGIRDANADDSIIIPCPDISRDAGYTAMANYLVHHTELPFDLLIAANDHRALGAIDALHQYGIAIPEQVAVTGFDDIPAAATAGLTTIHLPMRDIGTEGVKWFLHEVVGAPSNSVAQRCFPCPIIWRSTTGEPPAPEENEP